MRTATRTILDAGDRFDALRAVQLREEADAAFGADQGVIVDVRRVQHIDMAGLSALAWIMIRCRRRNEAAYLLGPVPPSVERLLDLTAFDRFFQVRRTP